MEIKYFKYKLCYEQEKSPRISEHAIQLSDSLWTEVEDVGYM